MSNADVIYSHLRADDLQSIEVNKIDMFFEHIAKKTQIKIESPKEQDRLNKQMIFEAHLLKPYYDRFIESKEKVLGNKNLWSNELLEKVEEEFMKKYMNKKRTYSY